MQHPFSFVFYNTENFYDTIDDPKTLDDEYTPEGRLRWTEQRFKKKVKNISRVLKDIVRPNMPDIIALAEIENLFVLEQLRQHENLSTIPYQIVHFDSPDERGSDVALLFNPTTFSVEDATPILVRLQGLEDRTRDILYVHGTTSNKKKIHIFVTHFPSRGKGIEQSEPRRLFVASVLRKQIDMILTEEPQANIVILGDFNDEPDNRSVQSVVKARRPRPPFMTQELYNLMYPRLLKGIGSAFYKEWLLFDQIIVSGNMMHAESGFNCKAENADVFNPRYLLFHDKIAGFTPDRTYGSKYFGGFSDHLPVFLTIDLIFD